MNEKKLKGCFCYVCNDRLRNEKKCLSAVKADHSKIPIIKILEKLSGRELSDEPERNYCCVKCLEKINDYDLACLQAEEAQRIIMEILKRTEEKYNFIDSTKNISENSMSRSIIFRYTEAVKEEMHSLDEMQQKDIECQPADLGFENHYDIQYLSSPYNTTAGLNSGVIISEELGIKRKISDEIDPIENVFPLKIEEECNETVNSDIKLENTAISKKLKAKTNPTRESILDNTTMLRTRPPKRKTKCGACNIEFKNPNELREHRAEMHADLRKIFICHICGVEYKNQTALKTHIGLHNGESPFKCDICGKLFTQKGTLRRHLPIHTGEKPYKCERCGKDFIHYSSFHMHTLAHDDYRDKKCDVCGQLFRSTSHLNRHKLVHTGLKPHSCPTCGQTFAQRYNMIAHYKSHEGIHRQRKRNFKCSKCGKGFFSANKLQEHEVACSTV